MTIAPDGSAIPKLDVVSGFDAGEEYQAIGRLPVPNNVPDDARKRLKRFAGVVNFAANRLRSLGDNANTLKIFIAPEFYFRPPRTLGPDFYHDTYPQTHAFAIFNALDTMFVHHDFQHWLFVPGTVLWNTSIDVRVPTVYFSTIVHVRGGRQNALRLIEKRLVSDLDGVPLDSEPAMNPNLTPIFQDWQVRKQHVFEVDGVPLGLEVCLDHHDYEFGRVLKRILAAWRGREGTHKQISLHLLPAGGMNIVDNSVAARVNGFILRNDGLYNPTLDPTELRKVLSYRVLVGSRSYDHDQFVAWGTAKLSAPMNGLMDRRGFALPDGPLRVPMRAGDVGVAPQAVVFYRVWPLP
jgi:hypothetical protein